ncbi:hypothetical protein MUY27_14200 [Mucilaginibacter sp. RS28]|uniref:Uncharacterized protein n=1 Tax=Mucilaginibacter straminoryzae TaxID=2932774 RepID=A0A9X1X4K9_9SPHI|nr:hypothetical protein [Mucilaginibacter straminoryzae]MCJ8210866.1 hypothetical protein [Mucilaginibacter straminoryzae]
MIHALNLQLAAGDVLHRQVAKVAFREYLVIAKLKFVHCRYLPSRADKQRYAVKCVTLNLMDQYAVRHFEMKLMDIYNRTPWLRYEITQQDFIALFPVEFKKGKPVRPEKPEGFDLDRDTYLAVMVAFRQAFS